MQLNHMVFFNIQMDSHSSNEMAEAVAVVKKYHKTELCQQPSAW